MHKKRFSLDVTDKRKCDSTFYYDNLKPIFMIMMMIMTKDCKPTVDSAFLVAVLNSTEV